MKEGPRSALAVRPISAPAAEGVMTMAVPTARPQATAPPGHVGLIDRFSVVLVALAATMWASDTYFRAQLIGHLKPAQIVVIEDALVSLFLLAFLLRGIPELRQLDRRGWVAIGLIAVGLQPVATILFTKPLSFAHYAETFVLLHFVGSGFTHYQSSDVLPFLGIALIPGFIALLLYYRALASTPATLATIAEMAYPVAATFIASAPPPYGFNQPLYRPQFIGTALLIAVIFILDYTKERTPPVVVDQEAAA